MRTRQIVTVGIISGLSVALMISIQISVFPPAPYLRWDPSDIATLSAAVLMGPAAGVLSVFVKCVLFLAVKGLDGPFGALMNFVASGTFAGVAGMVVRRYKGRFRLHVALLMGAMAMTLIMVPANLLVLPLQFGMSIDQVKSLIVPVVLPFNIIKGLLSAILAVPVIAALSRSRKGARTLRPGFGGRLPR